MAPCNKPYVFFLLVALAQGVDSSDFVQVGITHRSTNDAAADTNDATAQCEVTLYEHWAADVKPLYQGNTKVLQGTGKFELGEFKKTSSVKVTGEGCVAYGYTTVDCSGQPESPGAGITPSDGAVGPSTTLATKWGCSDCASCIRVEQITPAPTASPTAATPSPTPLPPQETPVCDGCGDREMECWTKCNSAAGYCDTCNSYQGTKGACCRVDESDDGVKTRPTDDNPQVCQDIPVANFKYFNYHACILTLESPHEIPKCTGCGDRNMECWTTCNSAQGYCDACDSAQGTKGACCRVNADGSHYENSPAECLAVPPSGYAYLDYHMCVLEMEIPKCTGCTGRTLECWTPCGKSGDCAACEGSNGTPGACCRVDNGEHWTDATEECKAIPVAKFSYWGYHMCVLK